MRGGRLGGRAGAPACNCVQNFTPTVLPRNHMRNAESYHREILPGIATCRYMCISLGALTSTTLVSWRSLAVVAELGSSIGLVGKLGIVEHVVQLANGDAAARWCCCNR